MNKNIETTSMAQQSNRDKLLFTPGPLTTSLTVKQAMLTDLGSRDTAFIQVIAEIRSRLVKLAQCGPDYTAILMQGSGTFGLEAAIGSMTPPDGKLLIIVNGAYGRRIARIAEILNINTCEISYSETAKPNLDDITRKLGEDPQITHIVVVHCETTTGIMNPIEEIGKLSSDQGKIFMVDAMSSFGAVALNVAESNIDYLVSSSNKCIEGVPGFSFVIARVDTLQAAQGNARSLSLDIVDQWQSMEKNGQFRFTPPTHTLLAFKQALAELESEGGVVGRSRRYARNYQTLIKGMREIGFQEYLKTEDQGHIITSFIYPDDQNFDFDTFYNKLNQQDCVIYPGKVSDADCFRIGNIGRIYPQDVEQLLDNIREVLTEMGVSPIGNHASKGLVY